MVSTRFDSFVTPVGLGATPVPWHISRGGSSWPVTDVGVRVARSAGRGAADSAPFLFEEA